MPPPREGAPRGAVELFVFGALTGLASFLILVPFAGGVHAQNAFGFAVVTAPFVELVRGIALVVHKRYRHITLESFAGPLLYWCMGYAAVGLANQLLSVFSLFGTSTPLSLSITPLAVAVMQIGVSLVFAWFVLKGRFWIGYLVCLTMLFFINAAELVLSVSGELLGSALDLPTEPARLAGSTVHVAVMTLGVIWLYALLKARARHDRDAVGLR